jgi:hypothetical protein
MRARLLVSTVALAALAIGLTVSVEAVAQDTATPAAAGKPKAGGPKKKGGKPPADATAAADPVKPELPARKGAPAPKGKPKGKPQDEASKPSAPTGGRSGNEVVERESHIEFDERMVHGQTAAGAIYLFQRAPSEFKSVVQPPDSFRGRTTSMLASRRTVP